MKILYFMNVDWGWIKQRPHFIAEGLAEGNDIILFHPCTYRNKKRNLCKNKTEKIIPHRYFYIPFFSKNRVLNWINSIYLKFYFTIVIFFVNPDLIWIAGNPYSAAFLSRRSISKAVYDCMDDYYAMTHKKKVLTYEKKIVSFCKHIFVSSNSLKNVVIDRYSVDTNKITLVRNGYEGNILELTDNTNNSDVFNLAYIGTISSWFDFKLIKRISESFENICIHIAGPIDLTVLDECKKIENTNIVFYGAIEHDKLFSFAEKMDCFIMPFIVNDIIRSVDPVKLYEYINFNKNILCVYYPEIERFKDFLYFYKNENEAVAQLSIMMNNHSVKYSNYQRTEFLKHNSWEKRMNIIFDTLIH